MPKFKHETLQAITLPDTAEVVATDGVFDFPDEVVAAHVETLTSHGFVEVVDEAPAPKAKK